MARPAMTLSDQLEKLYALYATRERVHPDPVELLYQYDDWRDREIAGLVAATLAYGRAGQIVASADAVLRALGRPSNLVERSRTGSLEKALRGFRHRFTSGDEMAALLDGARALVERHGSLRAAFAARLDPAHKTVLPALSGLTEELWEASGRACPTLLPLPSRGSACKRLNLFLRWMVRRDAIDPGGWDEVAPARLVVPLDTHMHRIALGLGLTARRQADMRTALEITAAFARFAPEDPVRYDFALTRLGIRRGEETAEAARTLLCYA